MEKSGRKTLVLSSSDIEEIVNDIGIDEVMDTLIDRMTLAFIKYDPAQTIIPIRSGFNYIEPNTGLIEWMPLFNKKENQVVMKMVGYHPDNPADFKLPTIVSTISSYDTRTGHLVGLMDGVFLTALRTGAASAMASRILGHPESAVLGLIGCGAQSITQLHAISRLFDLKKVLFYDNDPATSDSFIERAAMLNLKTEFIPMSIDLLVEQSDIITTATSLGVGEGPLFSNLNTKKHLHINAVGSDFPGKTELPIDLLKDSCVVPDFKEQAIKEGECQQMDLADIGPEFFECIQNKEKYQALKNQRTVFDSTGLPLEDQVVMDLFLEYAEQLGLGYSMSIEKLSKDAKSPYDFMYLNKAESIKKELPIDSITPAERQAKVRINK